jgi:hypothetical protein
MMIFEVIMLFIAGGYVYVAVFSFIGLSGGGDYGACFAKKGLPGVFGDMERSSVRALTIPGIVQTSYLRLVSWWMRLRFLVRNRDLTLEIVS